MKRQASLAATPAMHRQIGEAEARVGNAELFFDLIYVFCVTQISHFLLGNLTPLGLAQTLVLWFGVWLGWQYTCWFTNWFDPEHPRVRTAIFTLMILGLFMAAAIPDAFGARGCVFAWMLALMQVGRGLFMLWAFRAAGAAQPLRDNALRLLIWACLSASLWLAGAFVQDETRLLCWALAVACEYGGPMVGFRVPLLGRSHTRDWVIDGPYMMERCQLFVIVALGESLLMTGVTLAHHVEWDAPALISVLVLMLTMIALWWIYFDTSSKDGSRAIHRSDDPGRMAAYMHYLHVLLIGGIIVIAASAELVMEHPDGHITMTDALLMCAGPLAYMNGNALYKKVVYGLVPKSHWVGIGLLCALFPLAFLTDRLMVAGLVMLVLLAVAGWDTCCARHAARE